MFLAALVRSALGFGEALVAVPLLALAVPVAVAAPLAALVSVTVAGVVVLRDRRHVHVGGAWRLVVAILPGIPIGLFLLTSAPEHVVKAALAVVIIAFSAYRITGLSMPEVRGDRLAWPFGFAAGVLGGAYGMNGPPLAVYGSLRRWPPGQFRATLQGYFLPASLMALAGFWAAGLWGPAVTRYYLLSLPLVAAAIPLGRAVNRRTDERRFALCVHAGLVAAGGLLLAQSFRAGTG